MVNAGAVALGVLGSWIRIVAGVYTEQPSRQRGANLQFTSKMIELLYMDKYTPLSVSRPSCVHAKNCQDCNKNLATAFSRQGIR